jgi:hypothetical protein
MIIGLFIDFIYYILNWFIALLPKVATMPEWYDVIEDNLGVISALNAIPVISTFFYIASLVIAIQGGWQLVVFTNWIINKIRGSG